MDGKNHTKKNRHKKSAAIPLKKRTRNENRVSGFEQSTAKWTS